MTKTPGPVVTKNRRRQQSRRLLVESLEQRRLLAGADSPLLFDSVTAVDGVESDEGIDSRLVSQSLKRLMDPSFIGPVDNRVLEENGVLQPSPLFAVAAPGTAFTSQADDPSIVRRSMVDVRFDSLGSAAAPSKMLQLNLFGDTNVRAVFDQGQTTPLGSRAWIGHVEGVDHSQVILSVTNGMLAGSVSMPEGSYQILPIDGSLHSIQQIDQSQFPPELTPIDLPDRERNYFDQAVAGDLVAGDDPADEITVLVPYSPEARAAAGGTSQIEAHIAQAVLETNQSYSNSGVAHQLTLVHTMETGAGDSANNFSTDLSALQNTADGIFDNVDAARETYFADLVGLIIENGSSCGLGYVDASAAFGFSVTHRTCATGNYSFGHELGHNMGARHDWYIDDSNNFHKGFVNVDDNWRTVMAYNTLASDEGTFATRLPYWSNPDVSFGNPPDPMGVISTGPTDCTEGSTTPDTSTCAADNRLRLNQRAQTVANFRDSPEVVTGADLYYMIDNTLDQLVTVDNAGAVTVVGPFGADPEAIAYDSQDDILYGLETEGTDEIYTINRATGAATLLGSISVDVSFGLTYNPLDDLLYSVTDSGELVQINPNTLSATIVTTPGPGNGGGGLAYNPVDQRLYSHSNGAPRIYSYDAATLAGPVTHSDPTVTDIFAMTHNGASLVLSDGPDADQNVYSYDPTSGTTTPLFTTDLLDSFGIDGMTFISGEDTSEIHGQKWNDLNGDGTRDANELGLNGWVIELFNDQGALVDSQITMDMDLNGSGTIDPETERGLYWFTGLAEGIYTVGEVLQPGWEQTSPGGGGGGGGELVGVDFDIASGTSPGNWTPTDGSAASLTDLMDESGAATAIDLAISGVLNATLGSPASTELPIHTQSLSGLDGNIFSGSLATFTFSDLVPSSDYNVWVFGLDDFANTQNVSITGTGAINFTQTYASNQLFVNEDLGDSLRTLDSFSRTITSAADGTIVIDVEGPGAGFMGVGGLAIRPVGSGDSGMDGLAGDSSALAQADVVSYASGQRTTYSGLSYPGDRLDPEGSARALLSAHSDELGMKGDTSDLALIEVKQGLASSHTRFQQTLGGYPVYGAYVSVDQGLDGSIQTLHTQYYPKLVTEISVTSQSLQSAEAAASIAAGVVTPYLPTQGELVWYPLEDGTATLAWNLTIYSLEPVGDFLTLVDAGTGEVLMQENRVAFDTGSGLVYLPNPYQTQGDATGLVDNNDATNGNLETERVSVTLQGLNSGTDLLIGEFVDLATLNSVTLTDVDASEPSRIYEYDRDDERFEQVVAYHAIDSAQRYFHTLGFDDDTGPVNGIRDFPTLANAHWDTADQSFYSTGDDAIHFGDGGVDDAEDADIVLHEYGHAVQHDQNANWGGGEMGAMGEGFGDYLAASFYSNIGDPVFLASHAAAVGEWDATSYSVDNPPNLRRVDGTKVYPDDLAGEVHADGEIWSAALWDIRTALGGPTTDQLVLEHHFALPANATMPDAAQAILQADVNINAGANDAAIRQAFVARGILSNLASAVEIFYQDFESGLGPNETTSGAFTINNTNAPLNNGTLMMGHPGTYGNNEYSYYEVTLDLTGFTGVQLEFDYSAHIEDFFDGFNVQGSTSPIAPPNDLITPTSGLLYESASGLTQIGLTAYAGGGSLDGGLAIFDLSPFDDQVVNVRLQFGSDISETNPGINIDNLRVLADGGSGNASTHTVVLGPGETVTGIDFGNHSTDTFDAEIHGQKWNDLNGDGIRDADEPGLNDWLIELFDDSGALVGSQTTMDMDLDDNGQIDPETERGLYWFTGLAAGTYTVGEVQQPGWEQTSPGGGGGGGGDFRLLSGTGSGGTNEFSLLELQTNPVAEVLIGPSGYNPGLDEDPTTGLLYGASSLLRIIDPLNGSASTVGSIDSASETGILMRSIAFAPNGTLYGLATDPSVLYTIDKSTAFATAIGTVPGFSWGIDFAPNGTLYSAYSDLVTLDPATAQVVSTIGPLGTTVVDIDFAPNGLIYGVYYDTRQLYEIDPANASSTLMGTYSSATWGIASQSVATLSKGTEQQNLSDDVSVAAAINDEQSLIAMLNSAGSVNVTEKLEPAVSDSFYFPPQTRLMDLGGFLTAPSAEAPLDIALDYLSSHAAELGMTASDLDNVLVTDQYVSEHTGVTHIYLRQTLGGLEVTGADININITSDGEVINVGSTFIGGLGGAGMSSTILAQPSLTAVQALESLAGEIGATFDADPWVYDLGRGANKATLLPASGVSLDAVPASLHYVPTPRGGVELAWNLIVETVDGDHWFDSSVSAAEGGLVYLSDWIDDAGEYNVFAVPLADPDDGSRTLKVDPDNATASPFGWHDTDGVAGAEFTDTRGNNVFAQEDADANNTGGFRPDGGASLSFDFTLNPADEPIAYREAAITNLFYWNNILHDIHYQYGFDEAAGNFQENNYGKGGLGGDGVEADAQDGSSTNNANFGTPPDGSNPRMQQFIFTLTTPNRDSDLSNDIVVHEYGHGVSNRLTGGAANSGALNAIQSGGMGEGWGDWHALMLTQKPTDGQLDAYPAGTYVLGQPQTGTGIRRQPYSFDMSIDAQTYGSFNSSSEVHDAGEIWASALWDLNWLLINGDGGAIPALGFDPDLYNGLSGNNLAMQLVMDGMKLQLANPSFLDGRDAILMADQVANLGANQAAIWTAFARRGMGFSADDGGGGSATTVVEAFDLPATNTGIVQFDAAAYEVGDVVTITVRDSDLIGVGSIGVPVVSDGGDSETVTLAELGSGVFRSTITTSASGTSGDGTLNVLAGDLITTTYNDADDGTGNPAVATDTANIISFVDIFFQDFEAGLGGGESTSGAFTINNTNPTLNNGTLMMGHPSTHGDNEYSYYELTVDLTGFTGVQMEFDYAAHIEDFFDGFNVQASTSPIAPPNDLIVPTSGLLYDSALGLTQIGLTAYDSGSSLDSGLAVFDLSAFDGQVVNIRMQFGSDTSVTNSGINIDNLLIRAAGGGSAGTVAFDAAAYDVGDTVTVTVVDRDLTGTGSLNVSVNSNGGDSETSILPELGSGLFRGSLATSASGTSGDGTLNVLEGDVITATYNDANDGTGNPAVVTDTADIGAATTTNLILNGSFETGDFTSWTTQVNGTPFVDWTVSGAGAGAGFGMASTMPQDGSFVAWNGFDGSANAEFTLHQDVAIPNASSATLSWNDRVQWDFTLGGAALIPRTYDVELRDPVTDALLELMTTFSTGTQAQNPTGDSGWTPHSVDVSAHAGSTVRLIFREFIPESSTGPGQIEFDDVTLDVQTGGGAGTHTVVLAPSEIVTGIDFGNHLIDAVDAEIHGQKWNDLDGDGVRDGGETGLNGWVIELFNDQGVLVDSQITMDMDLNGNGTIDAETEQGLYWFTGLPQGTYTVGEVLQGGWEQTSPGGGGGGFRLLGGTGSSNSKMRSLNRPFEQINVEQFVLSAYETVQPIDDATPPGTYPDSTLFFVDPVDPLTHALDVQWFLDGSPIVDATGNTLDAGTLGLADGTYNLDAKVIDNTNLVRDEALRDVWMTETRSWTLEVSALAGTHSVVLGPGEIVTAIDFGNHDTAAPSTTSFARKTPTDENTNADSLVFLATFSEDVQNVDAADFAVTGTTGAISVTEVTPSTYDVTISGGDLAGLNATVGLNLNSPLITDLSGNALPGGDPTTDETYVVDNSPPSTVLSFPVAAQSYNATNWTDSISGTASDTGGAAVDQVEVSVQRLSDNLYWSGAAFDSAAEAFQLASGTTSWSLAFTDSNLSDSVQYTVRAHATDTAGNEETATAATFTFDAIAPTVVDVIVGSSNWNATFIDAVDGAGLGAGNGLGHSLVGTHQLDTLPWGGVDRIYVEFSEDVSASFADGDAAVAGTNSGSVALSPLSYAPATNIATIPLGSPLTRDRFVISLSSAGIVDAASNQLDGDWTSLQTLPSGNGTAGGQFDVFFNVLPGDANLDGSVNGGDLPAFSASFNRSVGSAEYDMRADWNADESVNGGDLPTFSQNFNRSLPALDPPAPALDPPAPALDPPAPALDPPAPALGQPAPALDQPDIPETSGVDSVVQLDWQEFPAVENDDDDGATYSSGIEQRETSEGSAPVEWYPSPANSSGDESIVGPDIDDESDKVRDEAIVQLFGESTPKTL